MQQSIASWLQALGLRALNTFGSDILDRELETCGQKRREQSRSQIEPVPYCCCFGVWQAHAYLHIRPVVNDVQDKAQPFGKPNV
eukprot:8019394-Pyramimonas_sp.AAC.1